MNHVRSVAADPFVKAQLVQIQRLQCDRTYRETNQSFYVEGVRNFILVIDNQLQVSQGYKLYRRSWAKLKASPKSHFILY